MERNANSRRKAEPTTGRSLNSQTSGEEPPLTDHCFVFADQCAGAAMELLPLPSHHVFYNAIYPPKACRDKTSPMPHCHSSMKKIKQIKRRILTSRNSQSGVKSQIMGKRGQVGEVCPKQKEHHRGKQAACTTRLGCLNTDIRKRGENNRF